MSYKDRGKDAEKLVKDLLEVLAKKQQFDYQREPDARAARGHLVARTADFLGFFIDREGVSNSFSLEVKEVRHASRLRVDHAVQVPRMRRRAMAGSVGFLFVRHIVETGSYWRLVEISDLDPSVKASWDLSKVKHELLAELTPANVLDYFDRWFINHRKLP